MIFALDYICGSSVWVCFRRATLEEDLLVFYLGLHMGLVFLFMFFLCRSLHFSSLEEDWINWHHDGMWVWLFLILTNKN